MILKWNLETLHRLIDTKAPVAEQAVRDMNVVEDGGFGNTGMNVQIQLDKFNLCDYPDDFLSHCDFFTSVIPVRHYYNIAFD